MEFRFEFSNKQPVIHPTLQFNAITPQNWNDNLPYIQQRQIVGPIIQHLLQNQLFVGYQDTIEYYSFYDENCNLHKCEHQVTIRRRFVDCWIRPNYLFRYWF